MHESGFNWFERVIGSITFWAIVLNIFVVVVEMIPLLGTILAAILTATCIAYLLPHLVTVGLVIDVMGKRLRWPLLLIPVFVYGAYYVTYFNQQMQVADYAEKMRARNPTLVVQYDPSAHDIIFDDRRDEARQLVKSFRVPVVYSRSYNTPTAYRSMTSTLCSEMQAVGVYKPPLTGDQPRCDFSTNSRNGPDITNKTARTFEWFEKPVKKPIYISIEEPKTSSGTDKPALEMNIKEKKYIFSFEGKEVERFITAYYYRLPAFPAWAYVCFAWERINCGGQFYSTREEIDTYPQKIRNVYGEHVVPGLLGLTIDSGRQISDFTPFPENEAIGRMLIDRKKKEKLEDFNQWGTRKDDARLPVIGNRGGVPSYEGGIYVRELGGPFYAFIRENEGNVVYIDARLDGNGNPGRDGFGLYGVCRKEEDCSAVDHRYKFANGGGASWDRKTFVVKGYWQVGAQKQQGEEDTVTELQGIEPPQ